MTNRPSAALLVTVAVLTAGCPSRDERSRTAHAHVFTEAGPAAGARLVVHDAEGGLLEIVEADEDGEAKIEVTGGETITAHYVILDPAFDFERVSVQSIGGVEPGDDLYFPVRGLPPEDDRGTVEVALTGGAFAGAVSYGWRLAGCAGANGGSTSPAGSGDATVGPQCTGDSFTPWAGAFGDGGALIAFQIAAGTPLAALVADGVTFPGPWRTDFDTSSFTLSSLPPDSESFLVQRELLDADLRSLAIGGASNFTSGITSTSGSLAMVPFPQVDFASTRVTLASGIGAIHRTVSGPVSADVTIDFSALPLFLTSAFIAADASVLQMSWEGAPTGARILELQAQYLTGPSRGLTWILRLPGDTPSPYVFPDWPAELAEDHHPDDPAVIDPASVRFLSGAEWSNAHAARTDDPRNDPGGQDRHVVERRAYPAP